MHASASTLVLILAAVLATPACSKRATPSSGSDVSVAKGAASVEDDEALEPPSAEDDEEDDLDPPSTRPGNPDRAGVGEDDDSR